MEASPQAPGHPKARPRLPATGTLRSEPHEGLKKPEPGAPHRCSKLIRECLALVRRNSSSIGRRLRHCEYQHVYESGCAFQPQPVADLPRSKGWFRLNEDIRSRHPERQRWLSPVIRRSAVRMTACLPSQAQGRCRSYACCERPFEFKASTLLEFDGAPPGYPRRRMRHSTKKPTLVVVKPCSQLIALPHRSHNSPRALLTCLGVVWVLL